MIIIKIVIAIITMFEVKKKSLLESDSNSKINNYD